MKAKHVTLRGRSASLRVSLFYSLLTVGPLKLFDKIYMLTESALTWTLHRISTCCSTKLCLILFSVYERQCNYPVFSLETKLVTWQSGWSVGFLVSFEFKPSVNIQQVRHTTRNIILIAQYFRQWNCFDNDFSKLQTNLNESVNSNKFP